MKTYTFLDAPLKVFGVPEFDRRHDFIRLPDELNALIPRLGHFGRRTPGARVGFRTDSPRIDVTLELETLSPDVGLSIYECQSAYVFIGADRKTSRYAGIVAVPDYQTKTVTRTFLKPEGMEEVLIILPRNEVTRSVSVSVEDGAHVEAPTPYTYPTPAVFYGSSITEGGCSSAMNHYNAILSRQLDLDYYNLGFSGNAMGDLNMAAYIASLDMSVFVLDYDWNAPTAEFLEETHEPFFRLIRERRPDLPVVIMTRPSFTLCDDDKRRFAIIRRTYDNARAAGDGNVWFVNGLTMFPDDERPLCSIDTIHPNDHGFHYMADAVRPVLEEILNRKK